MIVKDDIFKMSLKLSGENTPREISEVYYGDNLLWFNHNRTFFLSTSSALVMNNGGFVKERFEFASIKDVRFIAYGNGIFVAINGASSTATRNVYTSKHGKKFTTNSVYKFNAEVFGLCFFNGYFYAASGYSIYRSQNGVSWSIVYTGEDAYWYFRSLRVLNGKLFACQGEGTDTYAKGRIFMSTDGTTWTRKYSSSSYCFVDMMYDSAHSAYYAVGFSATRATTHKSTNDFASITNSSHSALGTGATCNNCVVNSSNRLFFGMSMIGVQTGTSTSVSWYSFSGIGYKSFHPFVFNDVFYIVDSSGNLWSSSTGENGSWTKRDIIPSKGKGAGLTSLII